MDNNKVYFAAAGSGKTDLIVKEALSKPNEKILITTFTDVNTENIRQRFIFQLGYVPSNVTVKPWFSFLIQNGIKPYQSSIDLDDYVCKGLALVPGRSTRGIPKSDRKRYNFNNDQKIYSDKLASLVIEENDLSGGAVVERLSKMYDAIFIDETQDLSGYDLQILDLLFDSDIRTLLVGDPRQGTYSTNESPKNKKYRRSNIADYFYQQPKKVMIDDHTLSINHRCSSSAICILADALYPKYPKTTPGNSRTTSHNGVFRVSLNNVEGYLKKYEPLQLRYDKRTKVNDDYHVLNFGQSKGLEAERVLIYPTPGISAWWLNHDKSLADKTRALLYVAVTRAKYSVAIVL